MSLPRKRITSVKSNEMIVHTVIFSGFKNINSNELCLSCKILYLAEINRKLQG